MVHMQHFSYAHLRPDMATISASFAELAHGVLNTLPMNAERTACLRKLLEAKDCAVRAYLEGATPAVSAEGVKPPAPSVAAGAARAPTPEEDGVGAPMAQSTIDSNALIERAKAGVGHAPSKKRHQP